MYLVETLLKTRNIEAGVPRPFLFRQTYIYEIFPDKNINNTALY